ncbi:MAG: hypothetical protein KGZ83_08865 [Sulfuricella sp.]|nr:hypothetical protein [Sulfuricella sp.]
MRDHLDTHTIDFIVPDVPLLKGQVLMDRQSRLAIIARRSASHVHLVRIQPSLLKLTRISTRQLVADWMDSDCPFDEAVRKLQEMSKRHGITDGARAALEDLLASGREPLQYSLFT